MSALIRYFLSKGKQVAGYDKTPSDLTAQLNREGAVIHYEDNISLIPDAFKDSAKTLVVYTPAVPETHTELAWFCQNGFEIMKRARVLGEITNCSRGLCIAGTHGKTTTSSMLAHLLKYDTAQGRYEGHTVESDETSITVDGKKIEILAAYEPCFRFMAEWWKQLYGESEGKEGKGLFPASVEFTADLHSMGQYIQQGERLMFETVVRFAGNCGELKVPYDEADGDGLNFLAGKDMDFIATQAMDGTLLAHVEGGVPNLIVRAGKISAYTCGELIYFFEYACGLSGYLLGVNPFDQPGVEAYKKNMFALLGKPGYEEKGAALRAKLGK